MTVEHSSITEDQRARGGRIEAAGWGVFSLWVGIALIANAGWGVGLVGVGLITLGAQAWRKHAGLDVDRFSATVGVVFVVVGVWNLLDLRLEVVPLLFIAAGVAILASTWRSAHAHRRHA